ncbi:MAG: hypothetical protein NTW87_22915 [Planctomycetota bacterium]|nr:hypothetical protein [Planctomycetota bacterium]
MITGTVGDNGVPVVTLRLAGKTWSATVDTGFNGDLELPLALRTEFSARRAGRVTSLLAGGQRVEEDRYLLLFPFDGEVQAAEATFVPGEEILLGTHLLREHRLAINFVTRAVEIERAV